MPQLTNAAIASECERIGKHLTACGAASSEIIRIQIGIEETLLRYREAFGDTAEFKIDFGKRLGRISVQLTVPGTMLDPFENADDMDNVSDFMRSTIVSMGQMPGWRYVHGRNVIRFSLMKRKVPELAKLFMAIFAAVFCGLLIRLAPDASRVFIQQSVVAPLVKCFLGFVNAIAGPMIFLSVVWGIYSIGDATTFSDIGKKLTLRYVLFLIVNVLIIVVLSWPLFHLNFASGTTGSDGFSVLYQMILDIVPANLITPFSQGNTLQILFIAILVGITLIIIGERSLLIASIAEQLSLVVNTIMGFVGKLIPFFVFFSLFSIFAGSEMTSLQDAGKFFFGTLAGCGIVLVLHTLYAFVFDHVSPAVLWKRSFSTFLIGLTTASSSAAFAENMSSCTNKHGISPKLANFGVPFGQILYKPSTAIMYWFAAISVAERSGIEVSVPWIITVLIMCIVLAIATPPVPGGTTASFTVLFTQLGLSSDSLAIILALNVIQDFFRTATNLFGGQCVLLDASVKYRL